MTDFYDDDDDFGLGGSLYQPTRLSTNPTKFEVHRPDPLAPSINTPQYDAGGHYIDPVLGSMQPPERAPLTFSDVQPGYLSFGPEDRQLGFNPDDDPWR